MFELLTGWFRGRNLKRAVSPPSLDELSFNSSDPESILHAASMLDQHGEWERAIALFADVESRWPDEHGTYAANSIEAVRAKMALGEALLCTECGEPLRGSICRLCGAERTD